MNSSIRLITNVGIAILVCTGLACGSDTAGPGQTHDVEHGFWGLTLEYRTVTLSTFAPFDTIRLAATPLDAFGAPLATPLRDSVVTKFLPKDPTDTNFVLDSISGFFRARHAESGIPISVRMTVDGITHVDSLVVNITDVQTPPVFSRIQLQAVPTDTLFQQNPFKAIPTVVAQALDSDDNPIDGATFAFRSSDRRVVNVYPDGRIQTDHMSHGTAFIYASTTLYGVTRVDSIPMTVTPSYWLQVYIGAYTPAGSLTPVGYFQNPVDTLAAGALVGWTFNTNAPLDPIDITFDDPSKIQPAPADSPFNLFSGQCDPGGQGNIAAWAVDSTKACGNTVRFRYFATPGTYPYHSERYGTTGTIVVLP